MRKDRHQPQSTTNITTVANSELSSSSESSQTSQNHSSASQPSSVTSDNDTSDLPSNSSDRDRTDKQGGREPQSNEELTLDMIPPSHLKGFVLFGVHGSKRLRRGKIRMAQIDVDIHKDDDSFFDEMILQYKNLRGYMRRIFSIWCFRTCELVKV